MINTTIPLVKYEAEDRRWLATLSFGIKTKSYCASIQNKKAKPPKCVLKTLLSLAELFSPRGEFEHISNQALFPCL